MLKTNVTNMESQRSGRKVANQFMLRTSEGRYFQSYDTVIAFIPHTCCGNGGIILDPEWNCSKTTSKYRSQFLGECTKETQEKIDNGIYKIKSLND